jgi:hypothetical protein
MAEFRLQEAQRKAEKQAEKQRAKSVPSIAQAVPASTIVNIYESEKFVAGKPRSQTVKGRKKPEGTIIPTQADIDTYFTPTQRMQPFVSEKQNGKPFLPDESYAYYIFKDGVYVDDAVNFLNYEEAELACLQKLIEIVKNK